MDADSGGGGELSPTWEEAPDRESLLAQRAAYSLVRAMAKHWCPQDQRCPNCRRVAALLTKLNPSRSPDEERLVLLAGAGLLP